MADNLLPEGQRPEVVTLYSKPGCVQCNASARNLHDNHIPFTVIDMSEDEEAIALVKELGYMQAPVLVSPNGEHWSGFRPDKIAQQKDLVAS